MALGGAGEGFQIGNAYGEIRISTAGISSAISEAKQLMQQASASMADSFKQFGDAIAGIGSALTGLTAPIAAAGAAGIKSAADFDTLMKQIEVFGGVAGDQLQKVRDFALDMGAKTKFSSAEAAQAYLELLKAGQSVEQATATLPAVLNLAAAGEMGLAQASGIVSSGLAIYNLKAEDAARVSDALARAANASRADVADLGMGMSEVGGVAAMFGLNIEQTSAILGVFANRGIEGSQAGTQLKSMLLAMNRDTKDAKDAWAQLGVSMYDAQGNMRDFDTVIKELDTALDKLPVEEQNRLMTALGGSFGIVGLNALRAEGGISNMLGAMEKAPDAAKVAAAFMGTFKGMVESLKGSIETLMIQALTPFMNNVLGPLVAHITEVINSITEWMQKNPELTDTIVRVLAAVVAIGPAMLVVGKNISAVSSIFKELSVAIGLPLSTIGLIVLAAAGLYLAIKNNFLGIRDLLEPIIKNVMTGLKTLVGVIGNLGNIIKNQGIGEAIASVINAIMQMFGLVENDQMAQSARDIGDGIVGAFLNISRFIQSDVLPMLQNLFNWFVTDALPAIVSFVQDVALPGIERFVGFIGDFWNQIQPGLQAFFNWVTQDALPLVVDFFRNVLAPAVDSFITGLGNIWAVIGPALGKLFNWFMSEGLPAITAGIRWAMDNVISPLVSTLGGIWESVGPALEKVGQWITDFIANNPGFVTAVALIGGAIAAVSLIVGAFSIIAGLASTAVGLLSGAVGILLSPVVLLSGAIALLLYAIDKLYPGGLSGILKDAADSAQKLAGIITYYLNDAAQKAKTFIDNLIASARSFIDTITGTTHEVTGTANLELASRLGLASGQGGEASFHDYLGLYSANTPYMVGTGAQPELFMPTGGGGGMAIPNADQLLGGNTTYNVTIELPITANDDPSLAEDIAARAAKKFGDTVMDLRRAKGGMSFT